MLAAIVAVSIAAGVSASLLSGKNGAAALTAIGTFYLLLTLAARFWYSDQKADRTTGQTGWLVSLILAGALLGFGLSWLFGAIGQ